MIQFDEHVFQMGDWKHQLENNGLGFGTYVIYIYPFEDSYVEYLMLNFGEGPFGKLR